MVDFERKKFKNKGEAVSHRLQGKAVVILSLKPAVKSKRKNEKNGEGRYRENQGKR